MVENKVNSIDNFLTGIYKITNTLNDKCYVGKSINVRSRLKTHYRELSNDTHHNYLLQHDFNLCGEAFFDVSILIECKEEELDDYESYFCYENNVWNKGYNIAKLKPSTVKIKSEREIMREEFISYLGGLGGLIETVNSSTIDIVTDIWKVAESSGLEEKLVKKIINTMTHTEKEQLPFVVNIESRGFYSPMISFRSRKRQEEMDKHLFGILEVL